MMRMRRNIVRTAFLVGCAAAPFCLSGSGPSAVAQPGNRLGLYNGVGQCRQCHTPGSEFPRDFVRLDEFPIWELKDKHAQAYVVLRGPLGQQMGKLLGVKDVTDSRVGCLGCHTLDPETHKATAKETDLKVEGVSCEVCHGPSGAWMGDHWQLGAAWRNKSAPEKAKLGFYNLRDPKVQAQLCLSCHVGNAEQGKVVTHAMYAAGHPPLPSVELAGFTRMMPPHWDALKDVKWLQKATEQQQENYDYARRDSQQLRLALVGAVMNLRQSIELLQERSTPRANFSRSHWPELVGQGWQKDPALAEKSIAEHWPELAMTHFDCAACHHELERPSWRQKRYKQGVPGRPLLPGFPRALLPVLEAEFGANQGGAGEPLSKALAQLDQVCWETPFGKPGLLSPRAKAVVAAADKLAASVDRVKPKKADALRLMRALCDDVLARTPDYDSARIFTSALRTIALEFPPGNPAITKDLADLEKSLNLTRDSFASEREKVMTQVFEKARKTVAERPNDPGEGSCNSNGPASELTGPLSPGDIPHVPLALPGHFPFFGRTRLC
jgi:hypothetical protein